MDAVREKVRQELLATMETEGVSDEALAKAREVSVCVCACVCLCVCVSLCVISKEAGLRGIYSFALFYSCTELNNKRISNPLSFACTHTHTHTHTRTHRKQRSMRARSLRPSWETATKAKTHAGAPRRHYANKRTKWQHCRLRCVCMCLCVCVCACARACMYLYLCVCVCIYICVCVCACVGVDLWVHVCYTWLGLARVGQKRLHTVYIQYLWQGNLEIYGHIHGSGQTCNRARKCVRGIASLSFTAIVVLFVTNGYECTHTHTHIHAHTHTRTHTNTRTHTRLRNLTHSYAQMDAERQEKESLEAKLGAMESKLLQGGVNLLDKVSCCHTGSLSCFNSECVCACVCACLCLCVRVCVCVCACLCVCVFVRLCC